MRDVNLLKVNCGAFWKGKVQSDFNFHGCEVFSKENVPMTVNESVVSAQLDIGLWERAKIHQHALREGMSEKSETILNKFHCSQPTEEKPRCEFFGQEACEACKWRMGIEEIIKMYLSDDVIFLEVFFSIPTEPAFENNFAAMVPVKLVQGDMCVIRPFNGCCWEQQHKGIPLGIDSCTEACEKDSTVSVIEYLYEKRRIMYYGMRMLTPFNRIPRDTQNVKQMYTEQNIYTYVYGLYALHETVGRTHNAMKKHILVSNDTSKNKCDVLEIDTGTSIQPTSKVKSGIHKLHRYPYPYKQPKSKVMSGVSDYHAQFVCNVLHCALNRFGERPVESNSPLMHRCYKDYFFTIVQFCIHLTYLGKKNYRRDLLGEDIRTRSMHRVIKPDTTLLPGGDCEDHAQTFAQVIFSAGLMIEWLIEQMPIYAGVLIQFCSIRYLCVIVRRGYIENSDYTQTQIQICM